MKKLIFCALAALTLASCKSDGGDYATYDVAVELTYPTDAAPREGVVVKLRNTTGGGAYDAKTDAAGVAHFTVPAGVYEVSATDTRAEGIFNLSQGTITVTQARTVQLAVVASVGGSILIKELYVGGCPLTSNPGKVYARDQYVVLYNNSGEAIDAARLCLAIVMPYNATASNSDYVGGALKYESWIPAGSAIWTLPEGSIHMLEPGKEMVIAINNAIDNTATEPNSINFNNADYFAAYDPEAGFNNALYYSVPTHIPESHWLKAYRTSPGNAWVVSQLSPAFFVFNMPAGRSVGEFVNDASSNDGYNGSATQLRKKVPVEWVVDGVEVFNTGVNDALKRFTPKVDAGYVYMTGKLGHTVYRNVDKEATEALAENAGKLVVGYAADPSGIDAEASRKAGARIIYKDTNNSSNDFHQRDRAALRD